MCLTQDLTQDWETGGQNKIYEILRVKSQQPNLQE